MSEVRQIVVSLPRKDGDRIKSIIREIAEADQRSLSNQVVMILKEWIAQNGYSLDEIVDENKPQTSTEIS